MTTYTLPPLPYDYDALEPWCAATTMELHHDKHHRAYVDGANTALEALAQADPENKPLVAGLRDDLTFQLGGHVMHSLFWENLTPEMAPPAAGLRQPLDEQFGSFERFTDLFVNAAVGVKGSGWAVLAMDPVGGRLSIGALRDHHVDLVPSSTLLAVLDVWEHAYYLQYQNRRADWVKAAVDHIDWACVADRYDQAMQLVTAGGQR